MTKLEKPLTRDVRVERDLPVPMADGVELLADRYTPKDGDGLPVVLIRTPYGRASTDSRLYGEVFAQRGYQVVVQSCRGTFGSGGEWRPFQTDVEDGVATVEWFRSQPWFGGKIGMFGPSYLGFVQWAVAAACPDEIAALSVQVGTSRPRDMVYPGGSFSLRTMLAWTYLVGSQAQGLSDTRIKLARTLKLRGAFDRLPLGDADRGVLGEHFSFFQDLLASENVDAPLWHSMDVSDLVAPVTAPVLSVTGWYDIFLTGQLSDYERLRQAGRRVQLVIGPWGHTSLGWLGPVLRGTLRLFDAELRGRPDQTLAATPVRVHLGGVDEWLDLAEWPPPTERRRLHLHPGGALADQHPVESDPDIYHYDPHNPTPQVGGNSDPGFGSRDNRSLEARPDVLTYTTDPLPADLDVLGAATADLFVHSSFEHTDFFVRLCDVHPRGKSMNVCDGIVRVDRNSAELRPDGSRRITVELWPTAHRFKKDHRVRVQVSSGSHPRYDRNLGSAEPLATAVTFRVTTQEVFHDPDHPSAITIPVRCLNPRH